MKTVRLTQLTGAVLLCFWFAACAFITGGCTETARVGPTADSFPNLLESDFQKHRNRPPTAKTLYAMADILATQGRESDSEIIMRRIVQEHPEFLPAYNDLAELQMRQAHIEQAIETLDKGLRIYANDPVLLNNLGMCCLLQKEYEKAVALFTRAAAVIPQSARYRSNLAVALALACREEESLSLFMQVLPRDQADHNLNILRQARKIADSEHGRHVNNVHLE
jgi:Flp pilus assembly protein TadD